ncbi:MAG: ABC transporter ATP-binding protein [Lachnospiraceae bacterium]
MSVIKVDDVHRKFKVYYDKGSSLKEKVLFRSRNRYEDRWVLKGISFEVEKGEAIALLGKNGCGKSTLLKLMTRIMYPNQGSIEIQGRVSSLIELGAGFHPDLSGRENIYTNASIFGLTKKEIDARLDDIIAFSELEEFIDNPVRTYSSGMYMRLAFSVAINVDADVLLIDEILAVGDTNFQAKCFEKLRELKFNGMTIVLVTHDHGTVEKFCDRAIWIHEGEIRVEGKSSLVVDSYLAFMNNKRIETLQHERQITAEKEAEGLTTLDNKDVQVSEIDYTSNHFGYGYVKIEKVQFRNEQGIVTSVLKAGEDVDIEIAYKVYQKQEEYIFGIGIFTIDGINVIGNNTKLDRLMINNLESEGINRVYYRIKKLPLLTGVYKLSVAIEDNNSRPMDYYRDYCHFNVVSDDRSVGIVSLEHEWVID